MTELIKKFITAFVISLLVFSVAAVAITVAISVGQDKYSSPDKTDSPKLEGESFSILLVMTDYAPDKFNDYDPDVVAKIFGTEVPSVADGSVLGAYRKIYAEDMALLRFDKERGQLTYTPIPGNTLVSVGGVKVCLEETLADHGIEFLVEKVHALLGVEIDTYAILTPENAARALDRIGQITYTVQCDMVYSDSERGISIDIRAGSQKLDGKKTVEMLRFDAYKTIGASRSSTATGYLKRFVNKLSEDFTYDELRAIIIEAFSDSLVVSNFEPERAEGAIKLLLSSDKLEVVLLSTVGQEQTVGSDKYFWLDEKATLEKFEPYRKMNAPDGTRD